MDPLTEDLRSSLARQVGTAPALPGLADDVVRRGRRARRVRRVAAVGTAAVVVAGAVAVASLPGLPDGRSPVAASLDGPPRVPLFVGQPEAELLDWPDGVPRARPVGDAVPVAALPSGVLLTEGSDLLLLEPDATEPRPVVSDLASGAVAVADDGLRATVVTVPDRGAQRLLQEVELPSGRVLRTVSPLMPPLVGHGEPVLPVDYSGDRVLLTLGEGAAERAAIWEAGEEDVVGTVDSVAGAVGGAGDLLGFAVRDEGCRAEVQHYSRGGRGWELCDESFRGFSPDGEAVLATNARGDGLVVRDASDGDETARFDVPRGVRASGWESADTVLHTTVDDDGTVVVRCSVVAEECETVASFPYVDRIPQPVPPAGLPVGDGG